MSDKFPQVKSLESLLVGAEDYKSETEKNLWKEKLIVILFFKLSIVCPAMLQKRKAEQWSSLLF